MLIQSLLDDDIISIGNVISNRMNIIQVTIIQFNDNIDKL